MKFGLKKSARKSGQKGKLIVIDGVDGAGKATQSQMLADALKAEGYDFEITDFPQYGKKSAGLVEEYLNGKYGQLSPYVASIFFACDRFDASFKIKQWLAAGKIVISNRYVTASAGHLGGKIPEISERVKYFRWLDNLEYGIFGIPKPDLNIILRVPAKIAQKLVDNKSKEQRKYAAGKKRDLHESDLKHLQNAEKVFIQISRMFPSTKLVECVEGKNLLSPLQVHNKVWNLVRRVVLNSKRKK
jgi:dTMP kinase